MINVQSWRLKVVTAAWSKKEKKKTLNKTTFTQG